MLNYHIVIRLKIVLPLENAATPILFVQFINILISVVIIKNDTSTPQCYST